MITKSQIIICQKRNRSGNNIRINIAWADKCGMINHVIKDMTRICQFLIIFDHFWPKSLNWPFRMRLILTEYHHFRANLNILWPNITIFDRKKLFSGLPFWPEREILQFSREFYHFCPFLTILTIFATDLTIFDRIWQFSTNFWQYLIFFDQTGHFWQCGHLWKCPF